MSQPTSETGPAQSETTETTESTTTTSDTTETAGTASDAAVSDAADDVTASEATTARSDPVETTDPPTIGEDAPVEFVQVEVVNVAFDLPAPSPVLHLRELVLPYRVVHFPVGLPEAQAIALALEHESSARPSTAELLAAVIAASGSDVVAVRLTGTKEGTILAELDLMTQRGHAVLDCRPTDGIALALRQRAAAPILCEASMLEA